MTYKLAYAASDALQVTYRTKCTCCQRRPVAWSPRGRRHISRTVVRPIPSSRGRQSSNIAKLTIAHDLDSKCWQSRVVLERKSAPISVVAPTPKPQFGRQRRLGCTDGCEIDEASESPVDLRKNPGETRTLLFI